MASAAAINLVRTLFRMVVRTLFRVLKAPWAWYCVPAIRIV